MESFKKEIIVNNETRLFQFIRMKDMNGVKFFITSKDSNQKPIAFSLNEIGNHSWKLTPGSLPWLYEIENELSAAILDTRMK